ncbi:MAG: cytochrome c3 family protein [Sedimentisphaerales bacterium]|nr:cytochrome c3 family protein [Sedimentisphaerales bacterium]
MFRFYKSLWEKSRNKKLFVLINVGVVTIVLAGLTTGGVIWHAQPGFCATCHTPMHEYVKGYKSGDTSLMVTPHAIGKSIIHPEDESLMASQHANGESSLNCLECHEPTIKEQLTEASHWITGNYYFPLDKRDFGTRSFCLSAECHDEADIIKATENYGGAIPFNQHDPRHGKMECNRCHSVHGKSVLMCNQCHNLKLPDGWIAPSSTGTLTNK